MGGRGSLFKFDSKLGWELSSAEARHSSAEFSYPVKVNSLGMRYSEISAATLPPTLRRIALLGDSFTWGYGVPDQQRFSDRVEKATGIKMLNFGVPSYGPAQYLLKLDEALELKPELVIVAFCLGNDWSNAVTYNHNFYRQPYARLDPTGMVVVKGIPVKSAPVTEGKRVRVRFLANPIEWLSKMSRLAVLSQELYARFFDTLSTAHLQEKALGVFRDSYIYDPESYGPGQIKLRQHAIAIVQGIFVEIKKRAEEAGSKVAILAVPTKCEYSEKCRGEISRRNDRSLTALKQIAESLQIPLIDPVAHLHLGDFFDKDQHWTKSGHRKVAHLLESWLKGSLETS